MLRQWYIEYTKGLPPAIVSHTVSHRPSPPLAFSTALVHETNGQLSVPEATGFQIARAPANHASRPQPRISTESSTAIAKLIDVRCLGKSTSSQQADDSVAVSAPHATTAGTRDVFAVTAPADTINSEKDSASTPRSKAKSTKRLSTLLKATGCWAPGMAKGSFRRFANFGGVRTVAARSRQAQGVNCL